MRRQKMGVYFDTDLDALDTQENLIRFAEFWISTHLGLFTFSLFMINK